MKARIRVTKKDIEKGEANEYRSCPVALALQRRGFEDVSVHIDRFYLVAHAPTRLSKRTREFVRDFDDGMEVKPFSFTINDPWLRKDSNGKLYFA